MSPSASSSAHEFPTGPEWVTTTARNLFGIKPPPGAAGELSNCPPGMEQRPGAVYDYAAWRRYPSWNEVDLTMRRLLGPAWWIRTPWRD